MIGLSQVAVTGIFDDIRSREIRFLEEASKLGVVTVLLWTDRLAQELRDSAPKFPEAERLYFLKAVRFVQEVLLVDRHFDTDALPETHGPKPAAWVVPAWQDTPAKRAFCAARGLQYHVLRPEDLGGFPDSLSGREPAGSGRKKVIVTGCYDWFHSGHVRFFQEVSNYGDLYVVVGHDANIRLLKGQGHPLLPQEERRYMAGSIRYVTQALVSSGEGWLDAEPEIQRLKPAIYAVNEDGDRGGKREYCARHGIEYLVLKRIPAPGLSRRSSTDLRGF